MTTSASRPLSAALIGSHWPFWKSSWPKRSMRTRFAAALDGIIPTRRRKDAVEPVRLLHLDSTRLRQLGLRDRHRQQAILVIGADLLAIDVIGHAQRAREPAAHPLGSEDAEL